MMCGPMMAPRGLRQPGEIGRRIHETAPTVAHIMDGFAGQNVTLVVRPDAGGRRCRYAPPPRDSPPGARQSHRVGHRASVPTRDPAGQRPKRGCWSKVAVTRLLHGEHRRPRWRPAGCAVVAAQGMLRWRKPKCAGLSPNALVMRGAPVNGALVSMGSPVCRGAVMTKPRAG